MYYVLLLLCSFATLGASTAERNTEYFKGTLRKKDEPGKLVTWRTSSQERDARREHGHRTGTGIASTSHYDSSRTDRDVARWRAEKEENERIDREVRKKYARRRQPAPPPPPPPEVVEDIMPEAKEVCVTTPEGRDMCAPSEEAVIHFESDISYSPPKAKPRALAHLPDDDDYSITSYDSQSIGSHDDRGLDGDDSSRRRRVGTTRKKTFDPTPSRPMDEPDGDTQVTYSRVRYEKTATPGTTVRTHYRGEGIDEMTGRHDDEWRRNPLRS